MAGYFRKFCQQLCHFTIFIESCEAGHACCAELRVAWETCDVTMDSAFSNVDENVWNIFYDGILRMEMPESTSLIGYTDDITAVCNASGQLPIG